MWFWLQIKNIICNFAAVNSLNMKNLIGRTYENELFKRCYNSGRAEFIIVSGRRRVGKTYLVNNLYEKEYAFSYVGGHHLTQKQQLQRFALALMKYTKSTVSIELKNWFDAFDRLKEYLSSLRRRRIVVFFDEMPWIDSWKSDFVSALEYFWNSWGAQNDNLMFIASGSATSWLNDNIIENKGGLHARITRHIYLETFTLKETEQYLVSRGIKWDRYQIAQAYMVFGGVPFYFSLLDGGISLAQNIDELFFSAKAQLRHEFDELYNALFSNSDKYISIVKALSQKKQGMVRNEISEATGLQGSALTRKLKNLEKCSFITTFSQFGNTSRNTIYRLSDFYTLFYFKFVEENHSKDRKWWSNNINLPSINAWQGFSFELICLLHTDQIKNKLGISGISTSVSAWKNATSQIDLVIDRADRTINVCEIKFSVNPYEITREYADRIRMRNADFVSATKTRKGIISTFVTTYGVIQGVNSSVAMSEVTMDDLFES